MVDGGVSVPRDGSGPGHSAICAIRTAGCDLQCADRRGAPGYLAPPSSPRSSRQTPTPVANNLSAPPSIFRAPAPLSASDQPTRLAASSDPAVGDLSPVVASPGGTGAGNAAGRHVPFQQPLPLTLHLGDADHRRAEQRVGRSVRSDDAATIDRPADAGHRPQHCPGVGGRRATRRRVAQPAWPLRRPRVVATVRSGRAGRGEFLAQRVWAADGSGDADLPLFGQVFDGEQQLVRNECPGRHEARSRRRTCASFADGRRLRAGLEIRLRHRDRRCRRHAARLPAAECRRRHRCAPADRQHVHVAFDRRPPGGG